MNLSKFIKKIKSFFCKKPILPKANLSRGYVSLCHADVKIYFDEVPIGTVQSISFCRDLVFDKVVLHGDMCFVLFDKLHDMLGKEVAVKVFAADEFGLLSCVFNEKILFISQRSGLAIDDIVTEEWYTFRGVLDETVAEHQERIKNTTGVFSKNKNPITIE